MSNKFTDEELEGLSEEERQALIDAEDDHADAAGEDDDPDAIGDDENDDDGAGGDGKDDGAGGDDGEDDGEDSAVFDPVGEIINVEEAKAKLAEIETSKQALRTKLNDGDISLDEYTAEYDRLAKDEREQERKIWDAEKAEANEKERWQWEQDQFFGRPENDIYKDKYIIGALNQAVIDLANDPKNANKKGPWFLAEADKLIRERFNINAAPKNNKQNGGKPNGDKPAHKKITRPPNLGDMPTAEHNETGGDDEFAHLDKLQGNELEAALARMTPEQEARYLAAR